MWFWKRNKEREEQRAAKEAEINRIKEESIKRSTEAAAKMEMLKQLIDKSPDDIALRIFAATGGDKRMSK